MEHKKLWGGRFSASTDSNLEKLNSSITFDKRMYAEDIEGSKAYAEALKKINLLTEHETTQICKGLDRVKIEWDQNLFETKEGDEDIHTANERRLKEIIGEPATKLHVGRSRNDQVVTDMKLWLRSHLQDLDKIVKSLIKVIITRSAHEIDIMMPGYTHLQRAQPVRWSHYLLSHAWNLKKDCDRLDDIVKLINIMPLGSGALAGNPFNIDRMSLASSLDFDSVTQNSMQAVGDRDFIAEFLFWASMVGIHLSRLAEDLILYSSKEFEFVTIDDTYSTGSSLMPQKRNPDSLELIRGIGGSLFGQCCSFMMVLKSLPSTYNKDLQYDKEAMFTTFDKLKSILEVATGTVKTLKVNQDKCKNALSFEMLATDVAYYLVRKEVPFRDAHFLAGKVVAEAERKGVSICDLTLEELKNISSSFDVDIGRVWNYEHSIEQYKAIGGTAKSSVAKQIELLEKWLM
ncbi:argininosuccinate lyase [Tribolium castaneum]|uniref:Argininosuccinate lyase-like Protein n=1 Tax=Tribolium castaneum TaxID=7070 RepID=D7EI90_TRICA|nr:PREDICTED: argininosuccinate lyase [Tribolium castaneum]EFA11668.2 Argininosuccinate lyase-like Protein [Tribolium castaneum]|eukprot:XP_008192847.1 PREDICTED: argininosuccinate lyase [Tribolium castaneum]